MFENTPEKAFTWKTLLAIKALYDEDQPWLTPGVSTLRKPSNSMVRTGRNGGRRKPNISDLEAANCIRCFAHIMAGVSPFRAEEGTVYMAKGASSLHAEIDRIVESEAYRQFIPNAHPAYGGFPNSEKIVIAKNWNQSKSVPTLSGVMDIYDLATGAIIEIKTIWGENKLPETLPSRTEAQVAAYLHGWKPAQKKNGTPNSKEAFIVYLPDNLEEFEPGDSSTYRIFKRTLGETKSTYDYLLNQVAKTSGLLESRGLSWIIENGDRVEGCERCERRDAFHEKYIIENDTIIGLRGEVNPDFDYMNQKTG